eukprot:2873169-Pyramimonas_sp.AAC.1
MSPGAPIRSMGPSTPCPGVFAIPFPGPRSRVCFPVGGALDAMPRRTEPFNLSIPAPGPVLSSALSVQWGSRSHVPICGAPGEFSTPRADPFSLLL